MMTDCPDDCQCEYACEGPYLRIRELEAELARLRAPVTEGEVTAVANHLRFDAQKHDVKLYRDAADLIQRLAVRVAELEKDPQKGQ